MSNHISEEGPRQGHAAGDTSVEQQASQLASDIKYKARQKMKQTSGSSLSPAQVQALYRQLLNASPAPGAVKSLVKKKLFEQVDRGIVPVSEHLKSSKSDVFARIFEGADDADGKFVIRVTDKATGNTSYRKADRAKVAQLRANPNISSVEITGRKKADDAYDSEKGGKKAKKDYDGDGKIESGTAEYMGSRDKAIKKAMAKEEYIDEDSRRMSNKQHTQRVRSNIKSFGSNYTPPSNYDPDANRGQGEVVTRKQMEKKRRKALRNEEVIYEKEDRGGKKLDVMKGKNAVKINPTIGESIRAELAALKAKKDQEVAEAAAAAGPSPEEKQQLMNKDKMLKKKIMMQKQTMQMQKQGRLPLNYSEEAGAVRYCPKCDKDETRDECRYGGEYWDENSKPAKAEDPRGMKTNINLAKNKLRAMGLKMSYDMEGELVDEATYPSDFINPDGSKRAVAKKKYGRDSGPKQHDQKTDRYGRRKTVDEETEDSLRDRRMERGGVDGNTRYDRPPARKATNAELGIKPGKTALQKELEKKHGKGKSAMDIVRAEITAKHGKGAVMNTKKK